jgi:hypothetical protein
VGVGVALPEVARPLALARLPDTMPVPSRGVVPPAMRLRAALARWRAASEWAGRLVQFGLVPEWTQLPPLILNNDSFTICSQRNSTTLPAMTSEIEKLISTGSVVETEEKETSETMAVSVMFPVPKKDGRTRPVINLKKTINPYVKHIHFKMEGLKTVRDVIRKDCWMVKIDLADAFHHVSLHADHQRFFRFLWKGKMYQWQVMPFGYKDAPRTFTKLMMVLAKIARAKGLNIVVYQDDILIMAPTEKEMERARDTFLSLLIEFGLTLNLPKSVLTPTQLIEFLGTLIDSRNMTFSLPPDKVEKTLALVEKTLTRAIKGKPIELKPLQRLIGTLQSATDCVLPTRLHLNTLIEALREAEANEKRKVIPSLLAQKDLEWWRDNLRLSNGKPILTRPPDVTLDTDASEKGWGAVHFSPTGARKECQGFFTSEMTSNNRELLAIHNSVVSLAHSENWRGISVRVRTDNQTSMAYINRMGGREPHLSRVAEKIHTFCLERKILLTAEYLPGLENSIADSLSRVESNWSEAQLHPHLFSLVETRWGPHTLDCFAAQTNAQCAKYVSLRLDTSTIYTDFLSRPASRKENLWAFPPFALVGRLLRKIEEEEIPSITLLIPAWPAQPWWPVFPHLLADWPMVLPPHKTPLLTWEEGKQRGHQPLWAWSALRLSGQRSQRVAFQKTLSTLSSSVTNTESLRERISNMITCGPAGATGVQTRNAIYSLSEALMWLIA